MNILIKIIFTFKYEMNKLTIGTMTKNWRKNKLI